MSENTVPLSRRIGVGVVREHFHSARAQAFLDEFRPPPGSSFLDLGGGSGDFLARLQPSIARGRYVVAELDTGHRNAVLARGFEFVELEESKPLPFADGEFDYVLSISVIEHVTLPKKECLSKLPQAEWRRRSLESQRWFADETRRVGKRYFVQTPNRNFPIESHMWLPFVNWFTHNMTVDLLKVSERIWIKKTGGYTDWNLLTTSDMHSLFPDARIRGERLLGITKSLIAVR